MIVHLVVCDGLDETGCPHGSTYRQSSDLPTYSRGMWSAGAPAHRVRSSAWADGWKLGERGDRCPQCVRAAAKVGAAARAWEASG